MPGNDRELLRRYHEQGDLAARKQLIERYMSLVRSLARRYSYRGEQLEDLVQIGCIGLIKAIDRFDLDRGVELVAVDDRVEDAPQRDVVRRVPLELGAQTVGRERPDPRNDGAVGEPELHGHVAVLGGPLEHGVQRRLEVVDALERQVEPRRDAAEHEVCDLVERLLARNCQDDLVARQNRPPF